MKAKFWFESYQIFNQILRKKTSGKQINQSRNMKQKKLILKTNKKKFHKLFLCLIFSLHNYLPFGYKSNIKTKPQIDISKLSIMSGN